MFSPLTVLLMSFRSVIGRECIIGEDVTLDGCYLFDGVKIGNGVCIDKAMVSWSILTGLRQAYDQEL